jgi:hypothetical protein
VLGNAAPVGIPAMYVDERYVEAGGLVSYGTDNVNPMRRGAIYVEFCTARSLQTFRLKSQPTFVWS